MGRSLAKGVVVVASKLACLRELPLRWILYWLVVPNLAIILMWPVGGPPMHPVLILYGALALVISQLPWTFARRAGAAVLMLWIFAFYMASMFAIPTLDFGMLAQFLLDVRPLRAPEYIVAGFVLAAVFAVTIRCAPRVRRLDRPLHFAVAGLAVFGFSHLDAIVSARNADGPRPFPTARASFSSAVQQVKLSPDPDKRRHVVVIMVEALGLPVAGEERRLFEAAWRRPGWSSRFDVSRGSTPYHGSTTSGELRELCGLWSDHIRFDFDRADCLPERFRDAGYATSAIHSFGGGLFNRTEWYPKLGFQTMSFADDLFRAGATQCDGVFPGACDKDVPAIIETRLAQAQSPQFVYWLTLNSHLPIMVDTDTADGRCIVGSSEWKDDFPRVCRMFQKHQEVADAVDRLVMSPDLPVTDVLIVGDHRPPFFDRGSRARFDPSRVPWIFLRYRTGAAAAATM